MFQLPRLVAKGNRQQSLLLWSHQLFGSAGHLVSAEQMRLEAAPGVWLLSNYAVSVGRASLSAFILKEDQRGQRFLI